MINPVTAQLLLLKCTGDEIWSVATCREAGIPQAWIDELLDCFESGFDTNRNTIYVDGSAGGHKMTNQYEGVLDLHIAYKLAENLGIDWKAVTASSLSRQAEVKALQEALDEI